MDRLSKAFIILSAIGIAVAVYHGYSEATYFQGPGSNICGTHKIFGFLFSCSSVFASGHDTFPPGSGIPLYIYGLLWFPLMAALGLWFGRTRGSIDGGLFVPLLMVGNLFTLYLLYLELGVIHALCLVCMSMYVLNYIMTILAGKALLDT